MILLKARFWSRMLPVTLQIPIGISCLVALWWRGLTALLCQCVSFSLIDVGSASSAPHVVFCFFSLHVESKSILEIGKVSLGAGSGAGAVDVPVAFSWLKASPKERENYVCSENALNNNYTRR
eukprot:1161577-Pelagomonas_calceolata.AAC.3